MAPADTVGEPSDRGPRGTVALLAAACGVLAANVYLAQPLAGPIAASLGLPMRAAGAVVMLTQLGYGLGLLLIVPLADRVENRRLILSLVGLAGLGLLLAGTSLSVTRFLIGCLAIGLGSVCVQVLVPYATHIVPEARRGRTVGMVTAGLMLGIMLARPAAGLISGSLSWPRVFQLAATLMLLLLLVLARRLPPLRPDSTEGFLEVLGSMLRAPLRFSLLRERIAYQAALFGCFSMFWTAVPIWLMGPEWNWSEEQVGIFALTAATGALAAPLAGALSDRGCGSQVTFVGLLMALAGFALTWLASPGSASGVFLVVLAASLINAAVTFGYVVGQRAVFGLDPGARARLNGIFMASFTLAGALGSACGGWLLAHYGWFAINLAALAALVLALLRFLVSSSRRQ